MSNAGSASLVFTFVSVNINVLEAGEVRMLQRTGDEGWRSSWISGTTRGKAG